MYRKANLPLCFPYTRKHHHRHHLIMRSRQNQSKATPTSPCVLLSPTSSSNENKVKKLMKDLKKSVNEANDQRLRVENVLSGCDVAHKKIKNDNKISHYNKNRLQKLYSTSLDEVNAEIKALNNAIACIDKIDGTMKSGISAGEDCNVFRSSLLSIQSNSQQNTIRRGQLMAILSSMAACLPIWHEPEVGPLVGASPAEPFNSAQKGDLVAAKVKVGGQSSDCWILAEVKNYYDGRYTILDIDIDDKNPAEHVLTKRRIIVLPKYKAVPHWHMESGGFFAKGQTVLALYPQTTCFYKAIVESPPRRIHDDYSLFFEDTSYPDGLSPALAVPQYYVIHCNEK